MKHLYIACCVPDGGVYHYTLTREGGPQPVDVFKCDRPMYMIVEKNEMHVLLKAPFAGSSESALVTVPLKSDGTFGTPGPVKGTRGVEACHLCCWHRQIYVVNYTSGTVFGTQGVMASHEGRGIHSTRQEGPHTHYIGPTPDRKYLMCTDLGLDTVFIYDDRLRQVSKARVPLGQGCRHLAASPDGKWIFCANELGSTVSVFAYAAGRLELRETVSALKKPNPLNTAAAIRVRGGTVYVSQRGNNTISVLSWDGEHLRFVEEYPCGGEGPRDFIVSDSDLIVTNEKSSTVTFLKAAGLQLQEGRYSLKLPAPLCAVVHKGQ